MRKYFFIFCFGLIGIVGLCFSFTPQLDSSNSLLLVAFSLAMLILSYSSYGRICVVKKICESYRSLNNSDCVIRLLLELNKEDLKDLISCMSKQEVVQEIERLENRIKTLADKDNYRIISNRVEIEKISEIILMLNIKNKEL